MKTQNFEKKAAFPVKKIVWPIFPRNIIEHKKTQETLHEGP